MRTKQTCADFQQCATNSPWMRHKLSDNKSPWRSLRNGRILPSMGLRAILVSPFCTSICTQGQYMRANITKRGWAGSRHIYYRRCTAQHKGALGYIRNSRKYNPLVRTRGKRSTSNIQPYSLFIDHYLYYSHKSLRILFISFISYDLFDELWSHNRTSLWPSKLVFSSPYKVKKICPFFRKKNTIIDRRIDCFIY